METWIVNSVGLVSYHSIQWLQKGPEVLHCSRPQNTAAAWILTRKQRRNKIRQNHTTRGAKDTGYEQLLSDWDQVLPGRLVVSTTGGTGSNLLLSEWDQNLTGTELWFLTTRGAKVAVKGPLLNGWNQKLTIITIKLQSRRNWFRLSEVQMQHGNMSSEFSKGPMTYDSNLFIVDRRDRRPCSRPQCSAAAWTDLKRKREPTDQTESYH